MNKQVLTLRDRYSEYKYQTKNTNMDIQIF